MHAIWLQLFKSFRVLKLRSENIKKGSFQPKRTSYERLNFGNRQLV